MLTQKQENFTLDLFKEFSEVKAYKNHYNTANMSIDAIYVEACRLAKNPKVALRLKELRSELRATAIADVEEVLLTASGILREELKNPVTAKEKILAGDLISKLLSYYPPERRQIEVNVEVNFTIGKGYKDV